jgi:hypothetical protein
MGPMVPLRGGPSYDVTSRRRKPAIATPRKTAE